MKKSLLPLVSALFLLLATPVRANETVDLLKEAIGLIQAGDWKEAREVIAIALDQADHHLMDTQAATFPEKVGVFTRGEVQTQKTMGIDMTQTTYVDAEGNEIDVQVMGGNSALGNIAELGATFGGGRKIRKHGRSGTLLEDDGTVTITLKLKNGKSFMVNTDDLAADAASAWLDLFPVADVDESGS